MEQENEPMISTEQIIADFRKMRTAAMPSEKAAQNR